MYPPKNVKNEVLRVALKTRLCSRNWQRLAYIGLVVILTLGELVPGELVPGELIPGELIPGELVPCGELVPGELVP
jgi:hypothetical protein